MLLNIFPLKMYDYLASGKIIIASDLPVYRDILKNNIITILEDDVKIWSKMISKALKSKNYDNLGKNARKFQKLF